MNYQGNWEIRNRLYKDIYCKCYLMENCDLFNLTVYVSQFSTFKLCKNWLEHWIALKVLEIKLKQTLQFASVSIVMKQQMCHSRNLSRRFFMIHFVLINFLFLIYDTLTLKNIIVFAFSLHEYYLGSFWHSYSTSR